MKYTIGQTVNALLPGGWKTGKVHKILKWFHGEIRYEIHGKDFVTITSSTSMK